MFQKKKPGSPLFHISQARNGFELVSWPTESCWFESVFCVKGHSSSLHFWQWTVDPEIVEKNCPRILAIFIHSERKKKLLK